MWLFFADDATSAGAVGADVVGPAPVDDVVVLAAELCEDVEAGLVELGTGLAVDSAGSSSASILAAVRLKASPNVTSKYAHAGTAVPSGMLSGKLALYEFVQLLIHVDHLETHKPTSDVRGEEYLRQLVCELDPGLTHSTRGDHGVIHCVALARGLRRRRRRVVVERRRKRLEERLRRIRKTGRLQVCRDLARTLIP